MILFMLGLLQITFIVAMEPAFVLDLSLPVPPIMCEAQNNEQKLQAAKELLAKSEQQLDELKNKHLIKVEQIAENAKRDLISGINNSLDTRKDALDKYDIIFSQPAHELNKNLLVQVAKVQEQLDAFKKGLDRILKLEQELLSTNTLNASMQERYKKIEDENEKALEIPLDALTRLKYLYWVFRAVNKLGSD